MKILLTGFDPFGDLRFNPTQKIVANIAQSPPNSANFEIITDVLPTEYGRAGQRVQDLLTTTVPDFYIGLGVAIARRTISLERVALNLNDARRADNAGMRREGQKIVAAGPLAYFCELPLLSLQHQLAANGFPVEISNHAGTYVCNHVFYLAQHHVSQANRATRCGFIHVPQAAPEQCEGLTLSQLTLFTKTYLTALINLEESPLNR